MLRERLKELSHDDPSMAHQLAREAARNDSLETVEVRDTYVVVEKQNFRGTHKITETADGWQIKSRGQYKTLFDDVDLTFTTYALSDAARDAIHDKLDATTDEADDTTEAETVTEADTSSDDTDSTDDPTPQSPSQSTPSAPSATPSTASNTPVSTGSTSPTQSGTLVSKVKQLFGI